MRIAVQAGDLDNGRIDGTRVYLRELLEYFRVYASDEQFVLYHQKEFNPALAPQESPIFSEKKIPFAVAWMQTRFAVSIFLDKPESLFLPVQAAPFFLPKKIFVTATIHDLAWKYYPETFPWWIRLKLNLLLFRAVNRADRLIAVSEATRKDILKFFPKLNPEKITVIHHGFNRDFYEERLSDEVLNEILLKFSLTRDEYFLYVGALQPRKNLVRLIQAFDGIKKNIPEAKLVLAGEAAWLTDEIVAAVKRSPYQSDIILTGRVSFHQVRALYQGARVFTFPSLYEGFGIPVLEALCSRVPVLTSSNSSLPEVGGEAVLYCQAEEIEDMKTKMYLLWTDEKLRARLIQASEAQLAQFSWEHSAKKTLLIIRGEKEKEYKNNKE